MSTAEAKKPVRGKDWVLTFTGKKLRPLRATEGAIRLEDIARGLAAKGRWSGQTTRFFSVAEHSVCVSRIVPREFALWGLLHDASEAFLGDVPTPVKRRPEMKAYREAEARMMRVILGKFGLPEKMPDAVKEADRAMLLMEAERLLPHYNPEFFEHDGPAFVSAESRGASIQCLDPRAAYLVFMDRFQRIAGDEVFAKVMEGKL